MRHLRSRVGFSNIWGFSRYHRVASLALSRFVFRYIRGRLFHDLKLCFFCFSGLALWRLYTNARRSPFFTFGRRLGLRIGWSGPVGSGRARLTVYGCANQRSHAAWRSFF